VTGSATVMKPGNLTKTLLWASGWLVCALGICITAAMPQQNPPDSAAVREFQRGRDLFTGRADLVGRIATHLADLPPEVVRCGNCHAPGTEPDVPRSQAPRLDRDFLLGSQRRRGGPLSRYDRDTFCRLLRKGIDPANMVVSEEMPRYTIGDPDCSALWRFLTDGAHEP